VVTAAAPVADPPAAAPELPSPNAILFFDSECAFCDRFVQFVMARDVHERIHVAPLTGETARAVLAPFADMLADVDSTVFYRPARGTAPAHAQVYSDAGFSVLRTLGGVWWVVGAVGLLVPRWVRDAVYKAIAARRIRWFGRVEACAMWPASWRRRMLP
jgi:predicted DCC family thiol-disulfide oxidoreductase YuxK